MENQSEKTSFNTKNFAASCLNHMQHGSTSTSLFIKDEQPSHYLALLESAFVQFQPFSDHDAGIVARCVHDHWILLRRERAADSAEASLFLRQPDPASWTAEDLASMTRFHRYKTEASRAYDRSLHALKTLKKLRSDEQRWQFHLESEKQKLAIHIERFELFKQRTAQAAAAAEEPPPDFANPPEPPPDQNSVTQTLFIGEEKGKAVIYETTPDNAALRESLSTHTQIVRTYNFVGSVPSEYRHLLTEDVYTFGKSTSVNKTYSYEDWSLLTESE